MTALSIREEPIHESHHLLMSDSQETLRPDHTTPTLQDEPSPESSPRRSVATAVLVAYQDPEHSLITSQDTAPSANGSSIKKPAIRTGSAFRVSRADEWWVLEIVCTLLSFGAVVAIFIVLKIHDGKPLSTWTFYFSVNTIVSTLGTLAKSSLALAVSACLAQSKWIWVKKRQHPLRDFELLDNASRGPLGSMELLWTTKGRRLASLGALVTITALAVDPSLQSLISSSVHSVPGWDSAGAIIAQAQRLDIGRAYRLSPYTVSMEADGNKFTSSKTIADFGTKAALYVGLLNSSTPFQLTPFVLCTTGNCTWPIFASLAVCSTCFEIPEYLNKTSMPAMNYADVINGPGNGDVATYISNGTQISLLPDNIFHINNYDGYLGSGLGELMTARVTANPKETLHFTDMETLLLSVSMLRAADSYRQNLTVWETTPITAVECGLYMCINAYNTSVTQGNLSETMVGTWSNKVPMSWQVGSGIESGAIDITNPTALGTPGWNPIYNKADISRSDFQLTIPTATRPFSLPSNIAFNITQAALGGTVGLLLGLFEKGSGAMQIRDGVLVPTSDIMQPLYASTNLSSTFANLAHSLSVAIRNSAPLDTAHRGTSYRNVIYFRIRWGWFVIPLTTTVAGCVFVGACIWQTRMQNVAAWKTSSLATLVHGLDEKTRAEVRGAGAVGVSKGVGNVKISMRDAPDGVELQGV